MNYLNLERARSIAFSVCVGLGSLILNGCGSGIFGGLGDSTSSASGGLLPWVGIRQLGSQYYTVYGNGIAVSSSSDVYVGGYANGGMDGNTAIGYDDAFLVKYDAGGVKQWSRQFGATLKYVYGYGIAADSSGNAYVAGETDSGFYGQPLTGSKDFFVSQFSSAGVMQWTRLLGVASYQTTGYGVAAGSSGAVYVTGLTKGNLDGQTFVGTPGAAVSNVFLTKYDTSGTKQWTKLAGVSTQNTFGRAVVADSSGRVYVAGTTTGSLGAGNTITGTYDAFISRYDAAGNVIWTKLIGAATKQTYGMSAATDGNGNVCMGGYTYGRLDGNGVSPTGTYDAFVSCYNESGVLQWTKQIGAVSANTNGFATAIDASGRVYMSGDTTGGISGNTLTGARDFFITQFSSAGALQWIKQVGVAGGNSSAQGLAVDLAAGDRIFTSGSTTAGLGGNTQRGSNDLFVSLFNPAGEIQ